MSTLVAIPLVATLCAFFALVMVLVSGVVSPMFAVTAVLAMLGGVVIALNPVIGLMALLLLSQLDAFVSLLKSYLGMSPVILLTAATFIGIFLNSWRLPRRERFGPDELVLRFMVLFGLAILISSAFAYNKNNALQAIETWAGVIFVPFLLIYLVDTQKKLAAVLFVVLGSAMFQGAIIVLDWVTGTTLLGATHAATSAQWEGISRSAGASNLDPTGAAAVLLIGTMLGLLMFLRYPRWRWLSGLAYLMGTAGIILSFARSAAIVYGGAILLLAWQYRHHRLLPIGIILALAAGVAGLSLIPPEYWERLGILLNPESDRSLSRRLAYNLVGLDFFWQNWLVGVGPDNFREFWMMQDYRYFAGRKLIPRNLHNMYLSVLVEFGVVGFSCFMGLHLAALYRLRQAILASIDRDLQTICRGIMFGYLAYLAVAVFVHVEMIRITWILPGLAVATARIAMRGGVTAADNDRGDSKR